MDEEAIFTAALEIESAVQRAAYLDEACAGDAGLRRKVEELLSAHVQAGNMLDKAAAAWNAHLPVGDSQVLVECPGTVIGPYKLLEQIGEGGFGVVFLAEQQQPVRRKVALKIIKPGMDTKQVASAINQAISSFTTDGTEMDCSRRLRGISLGGLSFLLSRRFDPGTLLIIELSDKAKGRALALGVHATLEKETRWIIGCKFVCPLNEEELQTLLGE
jgi:hypothetical protein